MTKKRIFMLSAAILLSCFILVEAAQALRITLKRVVFEGPKRAEVITIINGEDKPQTYRLGWRHFRMTSDKSLVAIPEGEPIPADIRPVEDMVRFAPRRFTIPPNSSQQIRMMFRMPKGLADGEYRSHFWVRPEADIEELRAESARKDQEGTTRGGVSLVMLAGVTMPVIVRKGALSATATLTNFEARNSGSDIAAKFSLIREGDKSIYGNLNFVCNPGASEYLLKTSRGIAVYTELNQRNFNLTLEKDASKPACRTMSVNFEQTEGRPKDQGVVLAEATATVQ